MDTKHGDQEFLLKIQGDLVTFMESESQELHLDAMNSYQRRLVHQLVKGFKVETTSEGEGDDRHVVVNKNEQSRIPELLPVRNNTRIWNYGDREFFVPMHEPVHVGVTKDGSVLICEEGEDNRFLGTRTVYSGAFKVKENKIIEFSDDEW